MKRLTLLLLCCSWLISGTIFSQQNLITGIVRGHVIDTSTTHLPIEGVRVVLLAASGLETEGETARNGEFKIVGLAPGRYLLSSYKKGYGDRVGKPVTVMAGGEHYVPIKMSAKEPPWMLLICLGVAAVLIVGIAIVVGLRDRSSD